MNDNPTSRPLTALRKAGLSNAFDRIPALSDRWTHWWRSENSVSQLDAMYLSPALAAATDGTVPRIERRGIGYARTLASGGTGPRKTRFVTRDDDPHPIDVDFTFPRYDGVTPAVHASDHCPIFLTLP